MYNYGILFFIVLCIILGIICYQYRKMIIGGAYDITLFDKDEIKSLLGYINDENNYFSKNSEFYILIKAQLVDLIFMKTPIKNLNELYYISFINISAYVYINADEEITCEFLEDKPIYSSKMTPIDISYNGYPFNPIIYIDKNDIDTNSDSFDIETENQIELINVWLNIMVKSLTDKSYINEFNNILLQKKINCITIETINEYKKYIIDITKDYEITNENKLFCLLYITSYIIILINENDEKLKDTPDQKNICIFNMKKLLLIYMDLVSSFIDTMEYNYFICQISHVDFDECDLISFILSITKYICLIRLDCVNEYIDNYNELISIANNDLLNEIDKLYTILSLHTCGKKIFSSNKSYSFIYTKSDNLPILHNILVDQKKITKKIDEVRVEFDNCNINILQLIVLFGVSLESAKVYAELYYNDDITGIDKYFTGELINKLILYSKMPFIESYTCDKCKTLFEYNKYFYEIIIDGTEESIWEFCLDNCEAVKNICPEIGDDMEYIGTQRQPTASFTLTHEDIKNFSFIDGYLLYMVFNFDWNE